MCLDRMHFHAPHAALKQKLSYVTKCKKIKVFFRAFLISLSITFFYLIKTIELVLPLF